MNLYIVYVLNILIIALPLAIFEIVIEKSHGWGSGWHKDSWHTKQFLPHNRLVIFLVKIFKIPQPLNYHFLIFIIMIPFVFALEYYYSPYNAMFFLAIFLGVLVAEDFLWFLLNWHFDSRKQLLKGPNGSIWWHKNWIKISKNYYLPVCYFSALALSIIIFFIAKSDTYANISNKVTTEVKQPLTAIRSKISTR